MFLILYILSNSPCKSNKIWWKTAHWSTLSRVPSHFNWAIIMMTELQAASLAPSQQVDSLALLSQALKPFHVRDGRSKSLPHFFTTNGGSDSKESACSVGYLGSIPGLGRFPGKGNGNLFQYSSWRIPWAEEFGEQSPEQLDVTEHLTHTHNYPPNEWPAINSSLCKRNLKLGKKFFILHLSNGFMSACSRHNAEVRQELCETISQIKYIFWGYQFFPYVK